MVWLRVMTAVLSSKAAEAMLQLIGFRTPEGQSASAQLGVLAL